MSNFDDYISFDDKPFAENINDALLLSNVFDFTVPIHVPTMFRNSSWVDVTSSRKCGVAILTLKESLPSGVSINTVDGKSVLTGTGTVKLGFYPNFNSFGSFKSIDWEETGTVQINLKTVNNTTIANNISKGLIQNPSPALMTLQEIVIEIVLNNSTLKSLEVVMGNKQQERYGAEVGITDVTDLQSDLDSKVNVTDIKDDLVSTDMNKPLSAKQGKILKDHLDNHTHTKSQITDFNHNHDDRYYTESEMDNKLNWIKHSWFNSVSGIDFYYNDMFCCLELSSLTYYGRIDIGNNVLAGFNMPVGFEPPKGIQTESVGSRITSIYVTSGGNLGVNYNGTSTVYEITLTGILIWRRV